jgi:hypothetical protein
MHGAVSICVWFEWSMVLFVARTIWRTVQLANVLIIRAHDMLRQVTPAILASHFIGVIGITQLAGNVDRLTSQIDARLVLYRSRLVVVFGKRHD